MKLSIFDIVKLSMVYKPHFTNNNIYIFLFHDSIIDVCQIKKFSSLWEPQLHLVLDVKGQVCQGRHIYK